jgi:alpha 1,3-glucosidase
MALYGAVPFLFGHSRVGYSAAFWLNPSETWVDVTTVSTREKRARFLSETGFIDFFLFAEASPASIAESYTRLTGRPHKQPLWAFGLHQCRWGYKTQAQLLGVSAKLDAAEVPHDVMWLDLDYTHDREYMEWNLSTFPDPLGLLDTLNTNRRRLVVIIDPHMAARPSYRLYKQAHSLGLTVRNPDGSEFVGDCWPGPSVFIDYLNPSSRSWWARQFSYSAFKHSRPNLFAWNDMNEMAIFHTPEKTAPKDLLHFGGYEERQMHNLNGLLMVSATYEGLRMRENKRPFVLTRSYFAGAQKFATVWTGDNTAEWGFLRDSVVQVLSLGIAGIVYSGSDVGGFFGNPSSALLARWYAVGAWVYPFFRVHNNHRFPPRELFRLNGTDFELAREAIYERYQLLPYWYTLAHLTNATGQPIVRPLWWEFGADWGDVDDRVMIGDALLVVPFLNEKAEPIAVDLPVGRWFDYRSGVEVAGKIVARFGSGRPVVFLRGGKIVPYWEVVRKAAAYSYGDPISLLVAVDSAGKACGEVYLDDPDGLEYFDGNFLNRRLEIAAGVLAPKKTGSGNAAYEDKCQVQLGTVIVVGINNPPETVMVGNRVVPFETMNGALVIRDIGVRFAGDWRIVIE